MNIKEFTKIANDQLSQKLNELMEFSTEKDLTPELASQFFSSLMNSLMSVGQYCTKTFFESYDEHKNVIIEDDKRFLCKQKASKRYLTIFGKVDIERNIYQHRSGGKCIIPLDIKWSMQREFACPEVKEAILFNAALMTPAEVQQSLSKSAPFKPSSTAIENIIKETGEWIDKSFKNLHKQLLDDETTPKNTNVMVASYDGVNLLLNEKGKRKGRPAERPVLKVESDKSSYRNATVGTFSFYDCNLEDNKRLHTDYIARSPEPMALIFKMDFEREFKSWDNRLNENSVRIFLADGATGIWNYIDNNSAYDGCYKLLDFYHASEHLSLVSEAIFNKKSSQGKEWYKRWIHKLKNDNDGVTKLIRSVQYYMDNCSLRKQQNIQKHLTYFQRNKHRMDYHSFLANNWPIGSGVVEAGCKSIVKTRLCRSGMRWSRKGAQNVLHLRSILKSQRWDKFWQIYNTKEYSNAA